MQRTVLYLTSRNRATRGFGLNVPSLSRFALRLFNARCRCERTDKDWSAWLCYSIVYTTSAAVDILLCHPRRKEYSYVSHDKAATDGRSAAHVVVGSDDGCVLGLYRLYGREVLVIASGAKAGRL